MIWKLLSNLSEIEEIKSSKESVYMLFKHSTRCVISTRVKGNFEKDYSALKMSTSLYLIDVLQYRSISNEIATLFQVRHESPQLLLIQHGKCVFSASHADIWADEIQKEIVKITNTRN